MSLPVYSVQPPGLPPPSGKCCLSGWYAAQDGSLIAPTKPGSAEVLVFDDRNILPQSFHSLIQNILNAKKEIGADLVLLDFERDPSPLSLSFAKNLSAQCSVAAPEVYCIDCAAEPIFCYCPAKEMFDAFCRRITHPNAWLELRPVDEEISYPLPGVTADESSQSFFSDLLQCHYTVKSTSDRLTLHFYDSPESLLHRALILAPRLKAAVGLSYELQHLGIDSNIKTAAASR